MISLLPPYSSALIVQQSTRLMQCNEHLMFQNKTWTLPTLVFMGMTLGMRHAVAGSRCLQHQGFQNSFLCLVLFSGQSRTHKFVLFVLIYHDVWQNSYFIVSDGGFRFDVGWLAGYHWNYNSHQPFHCDFRYTAIVDWL